MATTYRWKWPSPRAWCPRWRLAMCGWLLLTGLSLGAAEATLEVKLLELPLEVEVSLRGNKTGAAPLVLRLPDPGTTSDMPRQVAVRRVDLAPGAYELRLRRAGKELERVRLTMPPTGAPPPLRLEAPPRRTRTLEVVAPPPLPGDVYLLLPTAENSTEGLFPVAVLPVEQFTVAGSETKAAIALSGEVALWARVGPPEDRRQPVPIPVSGGTLRLPASALVAHTPLQVVLPASTEASHQRLLVQTGEGTASSPLRPIEWPAANPGEPWQALLELPRGPVGIYWEGDARGPMAVWSGLLAGAEPLRVELDPTTFGFSTVHLTFDFRPDCLALSTGEGTAPVLDSSLLSEAGGSWATPVPARLPLRYRVEYRGAVSQGQLPPLAERETTTLTFLKQRFTEGAVVVHNPDTQPLVVAFQAASTLAGAALPEPVLVIVEGGATSAPQPLAAQSYRIEAWRAAAPEARLLVKEMFLVAPQVTEPVAQRVTIPVADFARGQLRASFPARWGAWPVEVQATDPQGAVVRLASAEAVEGAVGVWSVVATAVGDPEGRVVARRVTVGGPRTQTTEWTLAEAELATATIALLILDGPTEAPRVRWESPTGGPPGPAPELTEASARDGSLAVFDEIFPGVPYRLWYIRGAEGFWSLGWGETDEGPRLRLTSVGGDALRWAVWPVGERGRDGAARFATFLAERRYRAAATETWAPARASESQPVAETRPPTPTAEPAGSGAAPVTASPLPESWTTTVAGAPLRFLWVPGANAWLATSLVPVEWRNAALGERAPAGTQPTAATFSHTEAERLVRWLNEREAPPGRHFALPTLGLLREAWQSLPEPLRLPPPGWSAEAAPPPAAPTLSLAPTEFEHLRGGLWQWVGETGVGRAAGGSFLSPPALHLQAELPVTELRDPARRYPHTGVRLALLPLSETP